MTPRRHVAGIVVGGLVAAALDILFAFIAAAQSGRSPMRVLQAIASGLLGADSFKGGATSAALGLLGHCLILIVAAGVYFAATRRVAVLREHPVPGGLLFGVCVYVVMNVIVLPISAIPFKMTYAMATMVEGLIVHAVLVGLPIALAIRHFSDRTGSSAAQGASRRIPPGGV